MFRWFVGSNIVWMAAASDLIIDNGLGVGGLSFGCPHGGKCEFGWLLLALIGNDNAVS